MSPLPRRIFVTSVVGLHLFSDLAAIPMSYRMNVGDGSGFVLFALFGSLLGQMSLLAAYLAWGSDHWAARWSKSCFLMVLAWYAITVGAVSTGDSFEVGSIEQLLAIVVTMSFLFISIPYWAIRAFCRSRFEPVQNEQRSAGAPKPQFRVRHLLAWTAAVAILIAILQSRIGQETVTSDWSTSYKSCWQAST